MFQYSKCPQDPRPYKVHTTSSSFGLTFLATAKRKTNIFIGFALKCPAVSLDKLRKVSAYPLNVQWAEPTGQSVSPKFMPLLSTAFIRRMKISSILLVALASIGLQANAEKTLIFKLDEAEFDRAVAEQTEPTEFDEDNFEDAPTGPMAELARSELNVIPSAPLDPADGLGSSNPRVKLATYNGAKGPVVEDPLDVLMIKFKKYTWDVKFIVFLESGDPTIPIWVEVFGKGGKNSPSNLVSLGKIQVYHGQFVGIFC